MTGQLSALAQGKAAGAAAPYSSLVLKTGQKTQYSSELDDGHYETGVAKSYTVNTSGAQSGTTNVDITLIDGSTDISFDATSKEIRGTGLFKLFKTAGTETIVVSGAANVGNNGQFTTAATGDDNKIIVTGTLTDESAGSAITIKKREAISNNTVLDNNTGLTWTRYPPAKLGQQEATGKFFWTGVPSIFQYCAAANAASLGGYTDWRVPNRFELETLIDQEATTAVPDSTAFPTGWSNNFWTSTTCPSATTQANYIRFSSDGIISTTTKTTAYLVTLVRGGI